MRIICSLTEYYTIEVEDNRYLLDLGNIVKFDGYEIIQTGY